MSNYGNLSVEHIYACDIETAGNETASAFHKKFDEPVKKPAYIDLATLKVASNIKDEAKIAARKEEMITKANIKNAAMLVEYNEKVAGAGNGEKDALSWMTGKVISIALTNVKDVGEGVEEPRIIAFAGMDEQKVLQSFVDAINNNKHGIFQIVGKSSDTFDWPFIKGRLMVHKIPMPTMMMNSFNLLDIDKMICFSRGSGQTGTLAKYAFALGLDGKLMAGSAVPKLYIDAVAARVEGNMDEYKRIILLIKAYCVDDTVKTAHIAYRLINQGR